MDKDALEKTILLGRIIEIKKIITRLLEGLKDDWDKDTIKQGLLEIMRK